MRKGEENNELTGEIFEIEGGCFCHPSMDKTE